LIVHTAEQKNRFSAGVLNVENFDLIGMFYLYAGYLIAAIVAFIFFDLSTVMF